MTTGALRGNRDQSFQELENSLLARLNPVQPNPEFVTHLRNRLSRGDDVFLERQATGLTLLWVIGAGLFAGALLIWLTRRLGR